MNATLRQINFNQLIKLETNTDEYDLNSCRKLNRHPIVGYCTACEEKGYNKSTLGNENMLEIISHGISTHDVLQATNYENDISGWHDAPVMFVMDRPHEQYADYEKLEHHGVYKQPPLGWYLIDKQKDTFAQTANFQSQRLGSLFNSIIFNFKLKNAYLTSVIKCGPKSNQYAFNNYSQKCRYTCMANFLEKEIEALLPKVVFCFGRPAYDALRLWYAQDPPFEIIELPMPYVFRLGYTDKFYGQLYSTLILEGLYKAGIFSKAETEEAIKMQVGLM